MLHRRACPSVRGLLPIALMLLPPLAAGCSTPVLTVFDTGVRENGSARLLAVGETQKGRFRRDPIAGQKVEYFIAGRRMGEAVTSAAGGDEKGTSLI